METKEVKKKVRKCLQKAYSYKYYWGKEKVTGKRKAGEEDAAAVIVDDKAGDEDAAVIVDDDNTDNIRYIECNTPSRHSCQLCKRCVCSMCCATTGELGMAWWCDECFKNQGDWNRMFICQGNYSSGDEDEE